MGLLGMASAGHSCSSQPSLPLRVLQHLWPPWDPSSWPSASGCPRNTCTEVAQGLSVLHLSTAAAEQMSGGNKGMERAPIGTETKDQEGEDPDLCS